MIIGLSVDNINDKIEFTYQTPLRGLRRVLSLTEDTTGEDASKFFLKHFKYSFDGVRYNDDWIELSLVNIQQALHNSSGLLPVKNDIIVKFRYLRKGTDPSGSLSVDQLTIGGEFSMEYLQVLDFEDTVYENVAWTDEYWNRVWLNLLQKTHEKGIIAAYIPRGEEDEWDDEDYILIWKTLSYFFALQIALVNDVITELPNREKLLSEYLIQRGLFICGDENLQYLQWISQHTYDIVRRRATMDIIREDGTYLSPLLNPRHGELLRFIYYKIEKDEFLFEYISSGITIGETWPTYYGLTNHLQLNKTPENTKSFVNMALYDGTASLYNDGGNGTALLTGGHYLKLKEMKVDSNIAYELTFMCNQLEIGSRLSVTLQCIDEVGFLLNGNEIFGGTVTNIFVSSYSFPMLNNYYQFRAIVFNHSQALLPLITSTLNIGAGLHIRMPEATKRINFSIENNSGSGGDRLLIWDLKFKPLLNQQPSVFVNGVDSTNIWMKNNNLKFTERQMFEKIIENLIPSNSTLQIKFL